MMPHDAPSGPARSGRVPGDVDGMLGQIAADRASRARDDAARARRLRRRPWMAPALLALAVVNLVLWLAPMRGRSQAPRHAAVMTAEQSRLAIVLAAQSVEAWRAAHGRLPVSDADLPLRAPGVSYRPVDATRYEVSCRTGSALLTYHSDESLSAFARGLPRTAPPQEGAPL